MAIEYAEQKVLDALALHKGNKSKASRQLMEWALADHQLLIGLTSVHLGGIIAYWTERMEHKQSVAKQVDEKAENLAQHSEDMPKTFGEEMLRSFAGQKTAVFGLEAGSVPLRRKAASQKHIDAINLIAGKKKTD